jgi:hypothetical protein
LTLAALALGFLLWASPTLADDAPSKQPPRPETDLTLADLAPYREALHGKPGGPATAVAFRALWDSPERYKGRRVRVEGRIARRFRQGAFGTFPPLIEAWPVSPSGDPLCIVFPDPKPTEPGPSTSAPGATVAFEGVFLRLVRYPGGDTARLAPLIVGDHPPELLSASPVSKPDVGENETAWGGFSRLDWALGIAAAAVVMLVLARQHLGRPLQRPLRVETEVDPPPEFVDRA